MRYVNFAFSVVYILETNMNTTLCDLLYINTDF